MKKITKIVSMLLVMTLICSTLLCMQAAMVSGESGDVLLDIDFDSAVPEVVGQTAGTNTIVDFNVTSDSGSEDKYVSVNKTAWNGSGYEFSRTTDGSFTVAFDFNIEDTESKDRYFMILPSKTVVTADKGTVILLAKEGKLYFGPKSATHLQLGEGYTANTWYTFKAYINTITGYCAVDVCKREDGTYLGGYNGVIDDKDPDANAYLGMVKNIEYGMLGLVGDGFYGTKIDNIKVMDADTYLFRSDVPATPSLVGETTTSSGNAVMTTEKEANGNTYFNIVKNTWNTAGFAYGANSDRTFNVEFDFNFDDAEKRDRYFVLTPGTNDITADNSLLLLSTTATGDICFACEAGSKARPLGKIEDDTWYTYKAYINSDTGYCVVKVYNRDTKAVIGGFNGTVLEKGTAAYTGIVLGKDYSMFGLLGNAHSGTKVDNILIYEAEKKAEYMLYADYDNYSTEIGVGSVSGAAIVEDGGNKVLSTDNSAEWNKTFHNFKPVSDGRIHIKFDVKKENNNGEWYIMLAPSSEFTSAEFLVLLGMNANGEIKFAEHSSRNTRPLGTLADKTWYTYEAIIDTDTQECEVKVIDKTTGLLQGSFDGKVELKPTENLGYTGYPPIDPAFSCIGTNGTLVGAKLDNLLIEKYYAPPAVPTKDTVTIKDVAGTVQNDVMAVSPLTKTIDIDFGTPMDSTTVDNKSVFVSLKDGTEALEGSSVAINGNVATITLPTLTKTTDYTLHVTTKAATKEGKTLDSEATYDFKTSAGEASFKFDNTKPGIYASLKGNEITIPCTYINSTMEPKNVKFIIAYYDANNMLVSATLADASFTAEQTGGAYEFKHQILDLENAIKVKIMAWESLGTLNPLSAYAELN